jgi:hypothetical protein
MKKKLVKSRDTILKAIGTIYLAPDLKIHSCILKLKTCWKVFLFVWAVHKIFSRIPNPEFLIFTNFLPNHIVLMICLKVCKNSKFVKPYGEVVKWNTFLVVNWLYNQIVHYLKSRFFKNCELNCSNLPQNSNILFKNLGFESQLGRVKFFDIFLFFFIFFIFSIKNWILKYKLPFFCINRLHRNKNKICSIYLFLLIFTW